MKENKPFLGICLGAQMCARQLGGTVFSHPEGHAEIGYYPIHPTAAGLAVVEAWPERVYQWHREGFDLPPGAELLAEGDTFEVQAIRAGRAYALQFHPDVTHAMMHKWTTRGHDRMELPGARPRHTHFADRAVYDYSARAWLSVFLERWLRRRDRVSSTPLRTSNSSRAAGRNRRPSWYRPATRSIAAAPGNWRCLRPRAGRAASHSL